MMCSPVSFEWNNAPLRIILPSQESRDADVGGHDCRKESQNPLTCSDDQTVD